MNRDIIPHPHYTFDPLTGRLVAKGEQVKGLCEQRESGTPNVVTNSSEGTESPYVPITESRKRRVGDVLSAEHFPESVRSMLTTAMQRAQSGGCSVSGVITDSVGSALTPSVCTVPHVISVDPKTGGRKGSKPLRYDLIPVAPLAEVALLYGVGSLKYADRNWEKGYAYSLSYAAMMRHLQLFWSGEEWDSEGFHHLAAVVFHAMALMEFTRTEKGTDDRV